MAAKPVLTSNKNFLTPIGFKFNIDTTKYPNLEYFCSEVNLPSITLNAVETPYRGVNLGFTGDRLFFDDLVITFNITENMENYQETFDWMHNAISTNEIFTSDAILSILSSHNNVTKEIKFNDCFPVSLSGADFTSQANDVEYLQASVTFKYTSFEFV